MEINKQILQLYFCSIWLTEFNDIFQWELSEIYQPIEVFLTNCYEIVGIREVSKFDVNSIKDTMNELKVSGLSIWAS